MQKPAIFPERRPSGVIATNPAKGIKLFPEAPPRDRVLSDAEFAKVVDLFDQIEDPFERAAFVVLLDTGARKSEVLRQAANIHDVTIHDLRRTFGLHAARKAGLHIASKLLRHSDIRVTERVYVPLGLEEMRTALAATQQERGRVIAMQRGAKRG